MPRHMLPPTPPNRLPAPGTPKAEATDGFYVISRGRLGISTADGALTATAPSRSGFRTLSATLPVSVSEIFFDLPKSVCCFHSTLR